ncbi:histamine H1 receptor [Thalassophryne amazonica]|uniref:histamine H1 receptor n=1 Tax=Thalassophryne amazonica TaxID=390379 RepID=UPI0014720B14|nr:histamine H1 receptor [Thalassophryne amazonica]
MACSSSPSADFLHLIKNGCDHSNISWRAIFNGDSLKRNHTTVYERLHSTFLGVFLGSLSLLTIIMNLLVLYAVKREKSLHTVGNLYIVSLSVADLIVGTTVMPLNLVYLLEDEWKLGRAICQLWLIMDYVASTASIFSLFILCLDRYRSVRQPLKYLKYRTRGKASVMISGAWLLSMMWIIPILGWRTFTHVDLKPEEENKCDTDFRFVTWFKVITAVFNFYVPSILMLWFYTHIYLAVRQHLRDRERIIHPNDSFAEHKNEQNAQTPEINESKSPKRDCNVPLKESKKQRLLDQNTLDQTYSLEDTDKSKIAASGCLRKNKKCQQTLLFVTTTKRLRLAHKARRCSLSPEEKQTDTEIPMRRSSVPNDLICTNRNNDNKLQASLNECHITVPNLVRDTRDTNQISDVQQYTSVLCNNCNSSHTLPWIEERVEDVQNDTDNEGNLKQSWQRFIGHSRQRFQSLRINKEHKAAKQLGFIITAFLLCWIPYFIAFMVMAFCRECVHHDLHMFTIWLGYINSTLNPFIYPLCNGNFKRVFRNILNIQL